ncbi:hypothetical protein FB45DRAFT_863411 [Roridomyces roridus]|uniref:Uncharacterized protein n=1 Tax=Roridomyces roridus TaxID=1738132 RepID=A0AAD7FR37_9AGAR|nr:hypothetical protein FB45DRAFT_863411 [Roridomyces roridus]
MHLAASTGVPSPAMHPLLQLNFNKLPTFLRVTLSLHNSTSTDPSHWQGVVSAAQESNADAFKRLIASIANTRKQHLLRILCIPLQLERVPDSYAGTFEEMEIAGPCVWRDRFLCALLSLDALQLATIPDAAAASLWPHVWAWIHYIHKYRQVLVPLAIQYQVTKHRSSADFTSLFLDICLLMGRDPPTLGRILATPGFRVFFSQAWMQISEPHPEIITERAVRTLASCSVFIQGLAPNQPENLLELVEVFGRAFWKLAPEERQDLLGPHLSAVYRFILDVNSQHLGSGYAPFFRRLLWEGFTLSLVPSVDRLVQVYVQVCQMPAHRYQEGLVTGTTEITTPQRFRVSETTLVNGRGSREDVGQRKVYIQKAMGK